uniref:(California timema) hypothetical protein n=1 Tax=Timema californicum TaxID=61474 RepID=A0A7R9JBC1_TIMCA|nr:unnamed protein product [Timema californicum]
MLGRGIKIERSQFQDVEGNTSDGGLEDDCMVEEFHSDDVSNEHVTIGEEVIMEEEESPDSDIVLTGNPGDVMSMCEAVDEHSRDNEVFTQEVQAFFSNGDDDIMMQHMDIQEPLSKLKSLLEQRLCVKLTDYEFWLQDSQILEPHKNLVDQCVQGEGLVQINLQIKTEGELKKINIVDVLKPAEEYIDIPENHYDQYEEVQLKKQPPEPKKQNVIRWIVDSQFKKDQERLKIPADPHQWAMAHVRYIQVIKTWVNDCAVSCSTLTHWLQWAVRQFNLVGVRLTDWSMTGAELCQLSLGEFQMIVPHDPGDVFWTHLELLRKCHFVAVVQKQDVKPQEPTEIEEEKPPLSSPDQDSNLDLPVLSSRAQHDKRFCGRAIRPSRPSKLPRVVGLPLNVVESPTPCGNRTGNNGQIQLWQFLLELLTDKDHTEIIHWSANALDVLSPTAEDGEIEVRISRKNKPTMNYEKLSRALRYYYDGHMISKVHGKRFVYKFVCDLKQLMGYSAAELSRLVNECKRKSAMSGIVDLDLY